MPLAILVEDNALSRKLLHDLLAIRFEVLEAGTAEIALELLESHIPDLMLVDLQLPGMDGLALMGCVKDSPRTAAVPLVLLSAHALQEDIDRAMGCGCAEYVPKPLVEEPLLFVERMARLATRGGFSSLATGTGS
jgi:two-component system cell cycle response regulator DivK